MSSISSSMTNLTSVSSVSSTSLASSTGGSKKRRAPKPPVLGALKTPAQIEEESAATDSEASTLHGGDVVSPNDSNSSSPQRKNHAYLSKTNASIERQNTKDESIPVAVGNVVVPDDPKEIEVLSASPVSSLSSPSNSASESNSSSPIPPSSITMKEQQQNRSLNTNEDSRGLRSGRNSSASATTTRSHQEEQEYYNHHQEDESGNRSSLRSPSRSSSTPSSSSNHNADAPSPAHADTTSIVVERSSRNVLSSSSSATTVDQDAQSSSCRPHSANTQGKPLKILAHFQSGSGSQSQDRDGEKWENFLHNLENILQKRAELV